MTVNYFESSEKKEKTDSLLIVEKDDIQRKGLFVALMDNFSEIRLTNNPHEAIELVKIMKFSVIITESGFDSISEADLLNNLSRYNPDAFIIMLSSQLNDEIKTRLLETGAKLILEKPVVIYSLLKEINHFKNIT